MQDTQRKMAVATERMSVRRRQSKCIEVITNMATGRGLTTTALTGLAQPEPERSGSRPESFRGNDRNYVIKSYNLRLPLQQVRSVPRDPDRGSKRVPDIGDVPRDRQSDRQTSRKTSSYTSYRCNSTNRVWREREGVEGVLWGWGQRTMNRHR